MDKVIKLNKLNFIVDAIFFHTLCLFF